MTLQQTHSHLFNIPIEYLDFPIKIFNSSKRIGVTSVGDLIALLRAGGPIEARNFGETTINEIEQKLREYGYWSLSEASTPNMPQNPNLVPIETLDLSTRVFNSLRRTGITTVGDILVMLSRGPDTMIAIRNFGPTSQREVEQKLKEHGYQSLLDEAETRKNQRLFNTPIETLGLSDKAIAALKRVDITSVGDCLRFFIQTRNDYPEDRYEYADKLPEFIQTKSHVPFFVFMFLEVEPILKERGYWSVVEDETQWHTLKPRVSYSMYDHPARADRYLDEVPVEFLGLSKQSMISMTRFGMPDTIGECIRFYQMVLGRGAMIDGIPHVMFGEVMDKMKENGFWSYVEAAH